MTLIEWLMVTGNSEWLPEDQADCGREKKTPEQMCFHPSNEFPVYLRYLQ